MSNSTFHILILAYDRQICVCVCYRAVALRQRSFVHRLSTIGKYCIIIIPYFASGFLSNQSFLWNGNITFYTRHMTNLLSMINMQHECCKRKIKHFLNNLLKLCTLYRHVSISVLLAQRQAHTHTHAQWPQTVSYTHLDVYKRQS